MAKKKLAKKPLKLRKGRRNVGKSSHIKKETDKKKKPYTHTQLVNVTVNSSGSGGSGSAIPNFIPSNFSQPYQQPIVTEAARPVKIMESDDVKTSAIKTPASKTRKNSLFENEEESSVNNKGYEGMKAAGGGGGDGFERHYFNDLFKFRQENPLNHVRRAVRVPTSELNHENEVEDLSLRQPFVNRAIHTPSAVRDRTGQLYNRISGKWINEGGATHKKLVKEGRWRA